MDLIEEFFLDYIIIMYTANVHTFSMYKYVHVLAIYANCYIGINAFIVIPFN